MTGSSGTRCVVVGYDGSDAAGVGARYAARRAGPGGKVVAVHAFGPPPDWLGHPRYQRVLDEHRSHGQEVLDELVLDDVELELELIAGRPAEAIVEVARTHDADEIVVGSRGLGKVRGALGSVGQELVHLADRPVTVIPEGAVARENA